MVAKQIRDAYHEASAVEAEAQLSGLARKLDKTHPGAAASLREGLEEARTALRLDVPGLVPGLVELEVAVPHLSPAVW